jgi:hypothetical protein
MPAGVSAYTALANVTLGSTAATVTFSSINQGFRDLVLVVNHLSNTGNGYPRLRFNSDSGANYFAVRMSGTGSAAQSNSGSSESQASLSINAYATAVAAGRATYIINIFDYSATDKHKTLLTRANGSAAVDAAANRWASTSAITSITFLPTQSMAATTTLALYGVSA